MIIKHIKTGKLYQLVNDACKAEINGKCIDAVCYRDIDFTGNWAWSIIDKKDFETQFISFGGLKSNENYPAYWDLIYALEKVVEEYPGKTIENVIVQLEARLKEVVK